MPDSPRFFAILPAAGRSQRMGRPKLLLPWRDATVIEQVLATWHASRAERIVVVVHVGDVELGARCRAVGVDVVTPDPPPEEMTVSVQHGLRWLQAHVAPRAQDAWLLAPADTPLLTTAAIDRVIAAHQPERPEILVASHAGRRGHPVLFPWTLAEEALTLTAPLNELARRHGRRLVECPADAGIFDDLDLPADYERLRDCHNARDA